jgi:UDP-glucose 4-epimerase
VYVSDVADAVIAAIPTGSPHRCNIGSGTGTNVNELCNQLSALTGYAKDPQYGPPRDGDIHAISLDASLARAELGWTPKVDLKTGLANAVEFFRQQS